MFQALSSNLSALLLECDKATAIIGAEQNTPISDAKLEAYDDLLDAITALEEQVRIVQDRVADAEG